MKYFDKILPALILVNIFLKIALFNLCIYFKVNFFMIKLIQIINRIDRQISSSIQLLTDDYGAKEEMKGVREEGRQEENRRKGKRE